MAWIATNVKGQEYPCVKREKKPIKLDNYMDRWTY